MKRPVTFAILFASVALMIWMFAQTPPASPVPLSRLVPAGPLLYLEAKDFGALLSDWNSSDVKRLWLESDNYQIFSRSRLYLKFEQAQSEFAAAAGVPPGMDLLTNVAGTHSALALYDIGQLEFLYLTRMSSDRFAGGALWKTRGNYQPRQSSGIDYFIKTDPASKRTVAFAAAKDYVVLATREDVLAGALSLIAGQTGPSVAGEPWFDKTSRDAKTPGELRMIMNLDKLTRSPHFRSYWIQQNITELKQYAGAISDASRSSGELREDRILLRDAEIAPAWNEPAVGELLRLAPANAGLYRAWASPSSEEAFNLIRRKILSPRPAGQIAVRVAPVVALGDGVTGGETDLETRIDEPPLEPRSQTIGSELRKLLDGVNIDAMLDVGSTRVQPDGVFVGTQSGVALIAAADWDLGAVRDSLVPAFDKELTTGRLGVQWVTRGTGANFYAEFDGLHSLTLAAHGKVLLLATNRELLESMLAGLGNPPAGGARYAALYRHSSEYPNFVKIMRLIDSPLAKDNAAAPSQPAFASGNIASIGKTLGNIDSESMIVHDSGAAVTQRLIYKLK